MTNKIATVHKQTEIGWFVLRWKFILSFDGINDHLL